jgi:hypothetical protein
LPIERFIVPSFVVETPYARWKSVISGGAFRRTGVAVVPIPRLTYRWDPRIR